MNRRPSDNKETTILTRWLTLVIVAVKMVTHCLTTLLNTRFPDKSKPRKCGLKYRRCIGLVIYFGLILLALKNREVIFLEADVSAAFAGFEPGLTLFLYPNLAVEGVETFRKNNQSSTLGRCVEDFLPGIGEILQLVRGCIGSIAIFHLIIQVNIQCAYVEYRLLWVLPDRVRESEGLV